MQPRRKVTGRYNGCFISHTFRFSNDVQTPIGLANGKHLFNFFCKEITQNHSVYSSMSHYQGVTLILTDYVMESRHYPVEQIGKGFASRGR